MAKEKVYDARIRDKIVADDQDQIHSFRGVFVRLSDDYRGRAERAEGCAALVRRVSAQLSAPEPIGTGTIGAEQFGAGPVFIDSQIVRDSGEPRKRL